MFGMADLLIVLLYRIPDELDNTVRQHRDCRRAEGMRVKRSGQFPSRQIRDRSAQAAPGAKIKTEVFKNAHGEMAI
jgi:hypothetical protein